MKSYSQALGDYLSRSTFADLSPAAIVAAKRLLIDTVGVAMAARSCTELEGILRCCAAENAGAGATVWSNGQAAAPALAAFANSAYAAALEFDSLHTDTTVHAGLVIVPAVLANAESARLNGKPILLALALGADLICRLAQCTRGNRGWFYTSLYGGMATAGIVTSMSGAGGAAVIANAMGLAFAYAGGTQQPASQRSAAKVVQGALATQMGMTCANLAIEGLDGPAEILEGSFGLFRMYEDGNAQDLLADLGQRYEGENISYKAYPICQCSHAAVDAMLALRSRHDISAAQVASIVVHVSPYMHRLVGAPFTVGATPRIDAQFSLQYCVARALMNGRLGIPEIGRTAVCDPAVPSLLGRIAIEVDPGNTGKYAPVELVVHLNDGRTLRHIADDYPGSLTRPLQDDEVAAKFRHCLDVAGSSRERTNELLECMLDLEHSDATALAACIRRCAGTVPATGA